MDRQDRQDFGICWAEFCDPGKSVPRKTKILSILSIHVNQRTGKLPAFLAPAVLLLAALLSLAACGDGETRQVRGQVIEVSARDFAELETLRIRDDAGREYRFTTEGFVGFTPSHVREHQLLGQSLLVTYEKRGEELVAVALTD